MPSTVSTALSAEEMTEVLREVEAGANTADLASKQASPQDLYACGEDLAGIMEALRWNSPRMPLAYNRNLARARAAGRLMKNLG